MLCIFGLTWAVLELSKETRYVSYGDSQSVMQTRGGDEVLVGISDFMVDASGTYTDKTFAMHVIHRRHS